MSLTHSDLFTSTPTITTQLRTYTLAYTHSTLTQIERLVDIYPAVFIRHKNSGTVVSWCLTYSYGALGFLHTLQVIGTCVSTV